MKHSIESYLNNQPIMKLVFTNISDKKQIQANFHGEGDFFMVEFKGISEDVCGGCGAKGALCGTWGVCDWESFRAETMDELNDFIEDLCDRLEADCSQFEQAA